MKNLEHNLSQVRKVIGKGVKIMVTIKADAYGHGLIPLAKKLQQGKVDYFGVASIDEGIKLRQAGIKLPILVLGVVLKEHVRALLKHNLQATVADFEFARALSKIASRLKMPAVVHLKVDTGMGRIGLAHSRAFELIKKIHGLDFIKIEGIFTHFPLADFNQDFTESQISAFYGLVEELRSSGIRIPLAHAANSSGLARHRKGHFNMVRPGLIIYGLYPTGLPKVNLKPLLSLKTKIVFVKRVPKDSGISYGLTYITKKDTTVVTLPIGYGDGYPRNLSNLGPVLIKGKRFTISGRVCMDQVMVDVSDTQVRVGDEAVLIGRQGKHKITTEELAQLSATIPYEIVCGLGSRIPRVYID